MYFYGELDKHKSDPKKFWRNMHSLLSEGTNPHIDKIFDPDTDTYIEGESAADLLNQYLVSIADKLTGTTPPNPCNVNITT